MFTALVLVIFAPAGLAGPAAAVEPVNPGGIGTPALVGSEVIGDPYRIVETGRDHRVVQWTVEEGVTTARQDFGGYVLGGVGAVEGLVVVRGRDNAIWYRELVGASWSWWRSLGGRVTATPAVGISQGGLRIVLVRGTNGAVYEKARGSSGWTQRWRNLGGQIIGAAAVGPGAYSDAYAFVRGRDNWLFVAFRANGLFGAWEPWRRTDEGGLAQQPGIYNGDYAFVVKPGGKGQVLWRNVSNWSEGDTITSELAGQYSSGLAGICRVCDFSLDPHLVYVGRGLDGLLYVRGELLR